MEDQGIDTLTSAGMQNQGRAQYNDESVGEGGGEEEEETDAVREQRSKVITSENFHYDLVADFSRKAKEIGLSTLSDDDPLVDSIFSLQSVQEMLEKEVHEFSEITSEHVLLSEVNDDPPLDRASGSGETEECPSSTSLQHEVDLLKKKLEDSISTLNQKEADVIKLENAVRNGEMPEEEFWAMLKLKREMEDEIDDLFKKRIEAEIKQIAMRRAILKMRKLAVEKISVLEGRKVVNQLESVKRKASDLNKKAERLETYCNDIVGSDEVLKLENQVGKFSLCFLIQFMLLVLFFIWFNFLQFSSSPPPPYIGDVPT